MGAVTRACAECARARVEGFDPLRDVHSLWLFCTDGLRAVEPCGTCERWLKGEPWKATAARMKGEEDGD